MRWQSRLKKLPLKIEAVLQSLSKVMAIIAAVVLAGMMLLTVGDVVGRYFFSSPIKGTWELVGLLLVVAGTWGLGYCQVKKAHISVTVLLDRFPPRVRAIFNLAASIVGVAGFSLICWRMFLQAQKYFLMPRGNTTDTLNIQYSPFMLALSIGAGLMALMLIVDLIRTFMTEVARK